MSGLYCGLSPACRCDLCHKRKPRCCKGPTGPVGPAGEQGPQGPTGPPGPQGEAPTPGYGYVFARDFAQVVGPGEAVFFNSQGLVSPGVTIDGAGFGIYIAVSGTYSVTWTATAAGDNAFLLVRDDVALDGTRYQVTGGGQVNVGQAIVSISVTDGVGQVLRLVNDIGIPVELIGGRINASILIKKLD